MDIHELLKTAIGKKVVHSLTGGCVGSIWNIEFEEGVHYMINCAWRVEHNGVVLTTCGDDATPHVGHMNESVQHLLNNKLLSYELSSHYDLTLYFENNYIVRVFCDSMFEADIKEEHPHENWYFCVPASDIAVAITCYFKVIYTRFYSNDLIEK